MMVKHSVGSLDVIFGALSDPTRRAILLQLAEHDALPVTTLAEPFDISLPAVSRHLRVLEQAGLLTRRKEGRVHYCRLEADPLREASGWLARYERFWEEKFDSLARFLEETGGEESNT